MRTTGDRVRCTTAVRRHDALGRAYSAVVAPFHLRLVPHLLTRAARSGWRPSEEEAAVPEHVYEQAVVVDAPVDRVWAVLVDVERWPSWTASVREVSVLGREPLGVGARVRIAQPRLPTLTWTVDRFEPGRSFSWTVRSPAMRGLADHRVEPAGDGTLVTLVVRQSGPGAGVARAVFASVTQRYMRLEAEGLKRRVEGQP